MKFTFLRTVHQCMAPTTFCWVLRAGVLFPLSLASSRPSVGECPARAGLNGPESGCWRWKVFPTLSVETPPPHSIYKDSNNHQEILYGDDTDVGGESDDDEPFKLVIMRQ